MIRSYVNDGWGAPPIVAPPRFTPRPASRARPPGQRMIANGGPQFQDYGISIEREVFLTLFLKFLGLLPLLSRPTSVIHFKTVYIDYHFRNPMKKMSPSFIIRTLFHHFHAIKKSRNNGIVYLEAFDSFKPQIGEIQGTSSVSAADLDLMNNSREVLQRNRSGLYVTSTEEAILALLEKPGIVAYDEKTLHLNQDDSKYRFISNYLIQDSHFHLK